MCKKETLMHPQNFLKSSLATSVLLVLAACGGQQQATEESAAPAFVALPAPEACQKLAGMSFTAESIGEPTTGATVTSAELIAADAVANTAKCSAPSIRSTARRPTSISK